MSSKSWIVAVGGAASMFLFASEALAHGAPLDRCVTWRDWNTDPVILMNLAVVAWLYARGWNQLQRGRGNRPVGTAVQACCFAAGILVTAAALISPLDPLGEQLASAHMVQHMVLMTVAAPLLILGAPSRVCFCGLPPAWRRFTARWPRRLGGIVQRHLGSLTAIWGLHAFGLWVWHLPVLYGAAVQQPLIHDAQHLTFFVVACLFWQPLLDPAIRSPIHGGLAVLYLFTTTLHATVLGVFMTIAPAPWYPEYIGRCELWGISPLEDQQLAGLIMWMPACLPYVLAAVGLFARAIQDPGGQQAGNQVRVRRLGGTIS